jgi:ketosteroid isomerase-like protein
MSETAVKSALDKVMEGYAERDMDVLLSAFAPDPDVVMYGTGADEKRIGPSGVQAQAERDWSQTESATITYEWMSISCAGPVAWAATDASFHLKAGGQEMTLPARITFVLERRGEQWLIVQGHFSLPAAGQSEGESFPNQ